MGQNREKHRMNSQAFRMSAILQAPLVGRDQILQAGKGQGRKFKKKEKRKEKKEKKKRQKKREKRKKEKRKQEKRKKEKKGKKVS